MHVNVNMSQKVHPLSTQQFLRLPKIVAAVIAFAMAPLPADDFSPRDLPGLRLWLRSDLGVASDAGRVVEWKDQSGNGYDATSDLANAPTLEEGERMGDRDLPAVRFNGKNEMLSSSRGLGIVLTDEFTLIMLLKAESPKNWGGVLYLLPAEYSSLRRATQRDDGCLVVLTGSPNPGGIEFYHQPSHDGDQQPEGGSYAYSNLELGDNFSGSAIFVRRPKDITGFWNGKAGSTLGFRMSGTAHQDSGYWIGANLVQSSEGSAAGPGRFGNFDLFELIVLDRAISDAELEKIQEYLTGTPRGQ